MLSSVDLDVLEPPPSPRSLQISTGQILSITVTVMITCLVTHENDGCAFQAQIIRTYSVLLPYYTYKNSMRDRMCDLMITDDLLEFQSPSSILAEVSSGDLDVLSDLGCDENCEQDDCNRNWDSS